MVEAEPTVLANTFLATLFALCSIFGTWGMIRGGRAARVNHRAKFTREECKRFHAHED